MLKGYNQNTFVKAGFLVILFAVYLFISRHALNVGIGLFDEGLLALGGLKINLGQVPYRDFQMRYTPGSVYLYAWIFKAFGYELINVRIASLINDATILILTLVLLSKITRKEIAYLMGFTYIFWGICQYHFLWYTRLSVMLVLIAIAVLVFFRKSHPVLAYALSGILCGLIFWTKQNIGLFAMAAVGLYYVIDTVESILFDKKKLSKLKTILDKMLFPGLISGLGFTVGFSAIAFYFYSHGALGSCLDQIIFNALKSKSSIMEFPGMFSGKIIFVTHTLSISSFFMIQYAIFRKREYCRKYSDCLLIWTLSTIVYFATILTGRDFPHLIFIIPFTLILIGMNYELFSDLMEKSKRPAVFRKAPAVFTVILAAAMVAYGMVRADQNTAMGFEFGHRSLQTEKLEIPHAMHIMVSPERNQAYTGIVNTINSMAGKDDCVFVFPYDVLFNYLLLRDNCTSITEFHQESFTRELAAEVVQELDANNVNYVILKDSTMPMKNSASGGPYVYTEYSVIYKYIWENFEKREKYLYWEVYVRKDIL